jgi:hypothetical protein
MEGGWGDKEYNVRKRRENGERSGEGRQGV